MDANKSKAEISALNNLRKLYDALHNDGADGQEASALDKNTWVRARPQSARADGRGDKAKGVRTSAVDAVRLLRQQHREPMKLISKSPSKLNYARKAKLGTIEHATVFTNWMNLAMTISMLERDASDLRREIQASETKCAELQLEARLPVETSELDPKLQCLEQILGEYDFRRYLDDLHQESARFRRHVGLYGARFRCFQQKIWETHEKRVTKETCLTILNHAVAMSNDRDQPTLIDAGKNSTQLVLLSQYPVLVQHCMDPQNPDRIALNELLKLLSALPVAREKLLGHAFEQIADVRRGEGYTPPPDVVWPHKLMALAKQSHANGLCLKTELEEISAWLAPDHGGDGNNMKAVSLDSFLSFHIQKSDTFCREDAEFVTYLMRIWKFQVRDEKTDLGLDTITGSLKQVLKSYEVRSRQLVASSRKQELVQKIQLALVKHLTKCHAMEAQVRELRVLQLNNPVMCCSIVRDSTLSDQVTHGLSLLKVLVLSGQCLEQFPAFVTDLQQLEELDLSDNRIFAFPAEMAQLQRLQRLVLSGNRLTDKSFQNGDINWANLAALSELQLSHNQLTTLPKALLALSGLQVLNVSNNLLRSLSASFAQLWEGKCKLVVLDLHHNVLTSLPEEIVVMKATLRCLLLHENNLTTLPSSMTQFQVLEELSLPNNALGSDFRVYPTTTAQTHIALEYNQLSVFPSLHNSVVKMYLEGTPLEIVSINVSWNRLRSIPPNALPTLLSSCLELHLQHNCLSELPEELFRALPQLRVCKLGINQLQKLPDSISSCQVLQVLDVQQNRLQTLPSELGQMTNLVVLNATENQLSSVPSAWHSFATYTDITTGRRVLQTLGLRKNPIQNKVLKTIIDGGNVGLATATIASTKSNDEQNCEFVLKKLIDALRDSLDVLAMETEGFNDDDDPEHNQMPTQKWKGMTRNVNRYLEAKLASISNDLDPQKQHNSSYLHVSERAFRHLIKALPYICSGREMTSLLHQFQAKTSDSLGKTPSTSQVDNTIDGFAFLLAIDQFGQHRTFTHAPAPANSSFSVLKPGDPIAPILHYLSILHTQQQQPVDHEKTAPKMKYRVKSHSKKVPKSVKKGDKAPNSGARRLYEHQQKQVEARERLARSQFLQRQLNPEQEVIEKRQKQRIQILEQQLMDQKLLMLSEKEHLQRQMSKVSGLRAPTWSSDEEAEESEGEKIVANPKQTQNNASDLVPSVLVCIKCMKGQEKLPCMHKWEKGPIRFSMAMESTVLAVKQQIEQETEIPVSKQVLIARAPSGGGVSIRLRNDASVKKYLEKLESNVPWHVTLLVAESLARTALTS